MAVIMLEDPHGSVEVVVFPEAYSEGGIGPRDRAPWCVVKGKVELRRRDGADDGERGAAHRRRCARRCRAKMSIKLTLAAARPRDVRGAGGSVRAARGDRRVMLELELRRSASRRCACARPSARRSACSRPISWSQKWNASAARARWSCDDVHAPSTQRRKDAEDIVSLKNDISASRRLCVEWTIGTDAAETLEFEEPIVPLLKEVDALSALPRTDAREREIELLNRRLRDGARGDLLHSSRRGSACSWRVTRAARTCCDYIAAAVHRFRRDSRRPPIRRRPRDRRPAPPATRANP